MGPHFSFLSFASKRNTAPTTTARLESDRRSRATGLAGVSSTGRFARLAMVGTPPATTAGHMQASTRPRPTRRNSAYRHGGQGKKEMAAARTQVQGDRNSHAPVSSLGLVSLIIQAQRMNLRNCALLRYPFPGVWRGRHPGAGAGDRLHSLCLPGAPHRRSRLLARWWTAFGVTCWTATWLPSSAGGDTARWLSDVPLDPSGVRRRPAFDVPVGLGGWDAGHACSLRQGTGARATEGCWRLRTVLAGAASTSFASAAADGRLQ